MRQGQFIFLSDRKAAVSKVRQTQPKAEDPETNEQITKPDMFPELARRASCKTTPGQKVRKISEFPTPARNKSLELTDTRCRYHFYSKKQRISKKGGLNLNRI